MRLLDSLGGRMLQSRALMRAPIWFYRHGLGRLLGQRILMLQHTGRTSGQARFVCLEVAERPGRDRMVVVSAFGPRAQWYRNLQAAPECHVSTGSRQQVPARARLLSVEESAGVLARYERTHPGAWRRLHGMIERATGQPVGVLPAVELALLGQGPD